VPEGQKIQRPKTNRNKIDWVQIDQE